MTPIKSDHLQKSTLHAVHNLNIQVVLKPLIAGLPRRKSTQHQNSQEGQGGKEGGREGGRVREWIPTLHTGTMLIMSCFLKGFGHSMS